MYLSCYRQLPKELDFCNEGKNSEKASAAIEKSGLDCVVPKVFWNHTSERVLCMVFEEGFRSTDVEAIDSAGLKRRLVAESSVCCWCLDRWRDNLKCSPNSPYSDVAKLLSSVFNEQVFLEGFVHCDPHPSNALIRKQNGKPFLVLLDHGLYKQLDDDFRIQYARLWRSLMMADVKGIQESCKELGVEEMVSGCGHPVC